MRVARLDPGWVWMTVDAGWCLSWLATGKQDIISSTGYSTPKTKRRMDHQLGKRLEEDNQRSPSSGRLPGYCWHWRFREGAVLTISPFFLTQLISRVSSWAIFFSVVRQHSQRRSSLWWRTQHDVHWRWYLAGLCCECAVRLLRRKRNWPFAPFNLTYTFNRKRALFVLPRRCKSACHSPAKSYCAFLALCVARTLLFAGWKMEAEFHWNLLTLIQMSSSHWMTPFNGCKFSCKRRGWSSFAVVWHLWR